MKILNVIEAIREAVLAGKMPGKSLGDVIQAGAECANEVDGLMRTLAEKEATIASLRLSMQTEEGRRLDALKAKLRVFDFVGTYSETGSSCSLEELGTLVKVTSQGSTMIRLGNGALVDEDHQIKDGEEVYFTLHPVALGRMRETSGVVAQLTIAALEQKLQFQKNRADKMTRRVEETEDKRAQLEKVLRSLAQPYNPFPREFCQVDCQGEGDRNW